MGWKRGWSALALLATTGLLFAATPAQAQIQDIIRLQGRLLSAAGSPVPDGDYGVTVRFYKAETDAVSKALTVYVDPGVKLVKGVFSITIGGKTKLDTKPFLAGDAAWVGVQVGSDPELPRFGLHQVPYALRAKQAGSLQCTGCITTSHLNASVLAAYAKKSSLAVYAKSADLAKVATSGKYADLSGKPNHAQLKTCPTGQVLTGYKVDGSPVCITDKNTTYTGKNFALSNQACPTGQVLRGISSTGTKVCVADKDTDTKYTGKNFALSNQSCPSGQVLKGISSTGTKICVTDSAPKSAADGMSATGVNYLKTSKLYNGTTPWTSGSSHNHTYNVNDQWLRDNGDNANVKVYGNKRQVAFRTDGTTEYAKGIGAYPFVWTYGGDGASNRRMMMSTDGGLWTSKYGWLDTKFQAKGSYVAANQACPTGQVLRGHSSSGAKICVTDANTKYSGANFALSNKTCSSGYVMRGVLSNGQPNCIKDANSTYSGANFALSNKTCGSGYVMRGVLSNGLPNCIKDANTLYTGKNFALSNKSCGTGYYQYGVSSTGNPLCRNYLSADLNANNKKITNLANPTSSKDAANKTYVDSTVASVSAAQPGVQSQARRYQGVIVLRTGNCPSGWTTESVSNVRGPNGWTYVEISEQATFIGGMNSPSHSNHHIYASFHTSHWPTKVCTRTFTSKSGNPHVSMLFRKGSGCPSGYFGYSASALKGSNNWGYAAATDAGFYLGYVSSWSVDAHGYNEGGGYLRRQWTSHIDTVCVKVMGVDQDTATKNGVFPVFVGVKTSSACPTGWTYRTTSTTNGSNGYFYNTTINSASFFGGMGDWGYGGGAYNQVQFHYSHVGGICYRYYKQTNGKPYADIRTPHTGGCPSGYTTFAAANVKGWNATGYIQQAAGALYIGGLSSWARQDLEEGTHIHTYSSEVKNRVCLRIGNAN